MTGQKTCFVVQGFGEKTDLSTGRKLNLDASYQIIKEAAERAGLKCVRADDIVHAGTIDKPSYQWILSADVVVADLSASNINAGYFLGIRYGVKPAGTIVIAEEQFKNPFDVSHMVIHRYKHLGEDIGVAEARRFTMVLSDLIRAAVLEPKVDSPIYSMFDLDPPAPRSQRRAEGTVAAARPQAEPADVGPGDSAKSLLGRARTAMSFGDFAEAKALLQQAHELLPQDQYVVQQLALATYKSKSPDALASLEEARKILLHNSSPETTNDPETLGLWGAIHKRLWELAGERPYLETAIAAYERGFYLRQDYYNGINLAFLFNVSAANHRAAGREEAALEDAALGRRTRRVVVRLCEAALEAGPRSAEDEYWIIATLWEASVGLGDTVAAQKWQEEARRIAPAAWMLESTLSQLATVENLLAASPLKRKSVSH